MENAYTRRQRAAARRAREREEAGSRPQSREEGASAGVVRTRRQDIAQHVRERSQKVHDAQQEGGTEIKGVMSADGRVLSDTQMLVVYGALFNAQKEIPKDRVNFRSAYFKEIRKDFGELQSIQDSYIARIQKEHETRGAAPGDDADAQVRVGYEQAVRFQANEVLSSSIATILAYNDVLRARGEAPIAYDQILLGKSDESVLKDIDASLKDVDIGSYQVMGHALVHELEADRPGSGKSRSLISEIASRKYVNTRNIANFASVKDNVAGFVAEERQKLLVSGVETIEYYGKVYGLESEDGTRKSLLDQSINLYLGKQEGYSDRIKDGSVPAGIDVSTLMGRELSFMIAYNVGLKNSATYSYNGESGSVSKVEGDEEKLRIGGQYLSYLQDEAQNSPESGNAQIYEAISNKAASVIKDLPVSVGIVRAHMQAGKPLPDEKVEKEEKPEVKEEAVEDKVKAETEVKNLPEGVDQSEVIAKFNSVKQAMGILAPLLNAQTTTKLGGFNIAPKKPLQGAVQGEGVFGEKTHEAFEDLMEHANFLSGMYNNKRLLAKSKVPSLLSDEEKAKLDDLLDKNDVRGFVPGNAETLGKIISENIEQIKEDKYRAHNPYFAKKNAADIGELDNQKAILLNALKDIEFLHTAGLLKEPVETVTKEMSQKAAEVAEVTAKDKNPEVVDKPEKEKPESTESELPDTLHDDIRNVKMVLFAAEGKMKDLPGMDAGGFLGGFVENIIKPLGDEADDFTSFGPRSQDMAATLIMGLKTLNGEKNADGYYDASVGNRLRMAILTKEQFQPIRDAINEVVSEAGGEVRLYGMGGKLSEADKNHLHRVMNYKSLEPKNGPAADAPEAERKAFEARYREWVSFGEKYKKEINGVAGLNSFILSMNNLQQEGVYDNKNARGVNKYNMMLDFAGEMLDQYFPGMKAFIQDFFANSQIGQMIGSLLGVKGIDISRLWGERSDLSGPEEQIDKMQEDFEALYDKAAKELRDGGANPSPAQIVTKAREMADESMSKGMSGVAFKSAMKLAFKGEDSGFVKQSVLDAYDDALKGATSKAQASKLFAESVRNALDGKEFEIQERLKVEADAKALEEEHGEFVKNTPPPSNPKVNYVGDKFLVVGDQKIALTFSEDKNDYEQKLRLSGGRVGQMQDVFARNAAVLGLTQLTRQAEQEGEPRVIDQGKIDRMKIDGEFSDMADKYTCSVFEEMLIHAKLDKLAKEGDGVISKEALQGLEDELKAGNLGLLLNENRELMAEYMAAKGVSDADCLAVKEAIESLANDFSSDPQGKISVIEDSLVSGQFSMNLSQVTNTMEVPVTGGMNSKELDSSNIEKTYKETNKNRADCEMPVFFKREGSNSVYAIINDKKNVLEHPDGPGVREVEFDMYLSTTRIQGVDRKELDAVLENYSWRPGGEEAVCDVINDVLDIAPKRYILDIKQKQEASTHVSEKPKYRITESVQEHKIPDCYNDFRKVDIDMQYEIADLLKFTGDEGVLKAAMSNQGIIGPTGKKLSQLDDAQRRLVVTAAFEFMFDKRADEIQRAGNAKETGVVFIDLEKHGVKHDEADLVMGMRNSKGGWDFRYANYEEDKVRPLSTHARDVQKDIRELVDPRETNPNQKGSIEDRRLDNLLFFREYDQEDHNRGIVSTPHSGGFLSMHGIVPGGSKEFACINGFTAVYDSDSIRDANIYLEHIASNYKIVTGYKVEMKNLGDSAIGNINKNVEERISQAKIDADHFESRMERIISNKMAYTGPRGEFKYRSEKPDGADDRIGQNKADTVRHDLPEKTLKNELKRKARLSKETPEKIVEKEVNKSVVNDKSAKQVKLEEEAVRKVEESPLKKAKTEGKPQKIGEATDKVSFKDAPDKPSGKYAHFEHVGHKSLLGLYIRDGELARQIHEDTLREFTGNNNLTVDLVKGDISSKKMLEKMSQYDSVSVNTDIHADAEGRRPFLANERDVKRVRDFCEKNEMPVYVTGAGRKDYSKEEKRVASASFFLGEFITKSRKDSTILDEALARLERDGLGLPDGKETPKEIHRPRAADFMRNSIVVGEGNISGNGVSIKEGSNKNNPTMACQNKFDDSSKRYQLINPNPSIRDNGKQISEWINQKELLNEKILDDDFQKKNSTDQILYFMYHPEKLHALVMKDLKKIYAGYNLDDKGYVSGVGGTHLSSAVLAGCISGALYEQDVRAEKGLPILTKEEITSIAKMSTIDTSILEQANLAGNKLTKAGGHGVFNPKMFREMINVAYENIEKNPDISRDLVEICKTATLDKKGSSGDIVMGQKEAEIMIDKVLYEFQSAKPLPDYMKQTMDRDSDSFTRDYVRVGKLERSGNISWRRSEEHFGEIIKPEEKWTIDLPGTKSGGDVEAKVTVYGYEKDSLMAKMMKHSQNIADNYTPGSKVEQKTTAAVPDDDEALLQKKSPVMAVH